MHNAIFPYSGTFIAIFLTGQYSTIDLAGVATGYNLWLLFYIFAQGTLLGITPIISQLLGAKKTDDISTIFIKVCISVQA